MYSINDGLLTKYQSNRLLEVISELLERNTAVQILAHNEKIKARQPMIIYVDALGRGECKLLVLIHPQKIPASLRVSAYEHFNNVFPTECG